MVDEAVGIVVGGVLGSAVGFTDPVLGAAEGALVCRYEGTIVGLTYI